MGHAGGRTRSGSETVPRVGISAQVLAEVRLAGSKQQPVPQNSQVGILGDSVKNIDGGLTPSRNYCVHQPVIMLRQHVVPCSQSSLRGSRGRGRAVSCQVGMRSVSVPDRTPGANYQVVVSSGELRDACRAVKWRGRQKLNHMPDYNDCSISAPTSYCRACIILFAIEAYLPREPKRALRQPGMYESSIDKLVSKSMIICRVYQ